VLDEPTSFLDPLGAKNIFEVLDDLNRSLGITVILVEHRLDLAAKYADHVIIMDKGKIVLDGEPREVLSSQKARLLGVGVPKTIRLYQILEGENSSDRVQVPLTPEEMMDFLRGALKK
jgi:energy-coupling factor transporter ATP-binding protein EcfA2